MRLRGCCSTRGAVPVTGRPFSTGMTAQSSKPGATSRDRPLHGLHPRGEGSISAPHVPSRVVPDAAAGIGHGRRHPRVVLRDPHASGRAHGGVRRVRSGSRPGGACSSDTSSANPGRPSFMRSHPRSSGPPRPCPRCSPRPTSSCSGPRPASESAARSAPAPTEPSAPASRDPAPSRTPSQICTVSQVLAPSVRHRRESAPARGRTGAPGRLSYADRTRTRTGTGTGTRTAGRGARVSKAATVYDVAERAGVSIATVSRVLRSPDAVRPVTRERVLDAVAALGYVPSGSARGLAERRTGCWGCTSPSSTPPRTPRRSTCCPPLPARRSRSCRTTRTRRTPRCCSSTRSCGGRAGGVEAGVRAHGGRRT